MTSHIFPIDIDSVDTRRPGAYGLLIRHGEREPITTENNNMLGAQLTGAGRAQARQLGVRLRGQRSHLFFSSPVARCVDTNVCILEGLGVDPEAARQRAEPHPVLVEAYMENPETAKAVFRLSDPEQVILDYLSGRDVPGFGPIERGARALLRFVRNNIQSGTLSIFVTHDALVMPFRQHFLGDEYRRDSWLPFLGGSVIYTEGERTWVDGREVCPI